MFGKSLRRHSSNNASQNRSAKRRNACSGKSLIESLESRQLMSVVITPQFGALPQKQAPGSVMNNAPINVVFWGNFWEGTNSTDPSTWTDNKSPQAEKLLVSLKQLISSTYLNETEQYGADPRNMFLNDTAWLPSNPGTVVSGDDVDNAVQTEIGKVFPSPGNQTDGHGNHVAPIYLVITPPGTSSTETQDAAWNTYAGDRPEIWMGTAGTSGDNTNVNIDRYTRLIGHEIAEIMTDPGGNGFEVNTPAQWAAVGGGGDDQIGDMEGNAYQFRMSDSNGNPSFQVQPLWSAADQAWVVSDGTAQQFDLVPMDWNTTGAHPSFGGQFSLVIKGDQWLNINDQVTLSTNSNGGVKVNLNNEIVNFDPGVLTSITLQLGAGTNSVSFANELPHTVPVTMSASGGTIVLKGPIDSTNTWNFTDTGIGNILSTGPQGYAQTIFNNVSSVVGGPLKDTFNFEDFGELPGTVDGGGGGDVLDYSIYANTGAMQPASVNLTTHTATGIGQTFSNISAVLGSAASDTLTGNGIFTINGANVGAVDGVQFSGIENLAGGATNDTFKFLPGGSISGLVDGGAGTDTLDYSALAGPVTVNFDTNTATGVGSFANMELVVASQGGNDTIVGDAWVFTGVNSGTVNGVAFSSFSNLVAGSADDSFTFMPGGSIAGNIDGGAGNNTLNYVNWPGATINLSNNTATGIGGRFANINRFAGNGSSTVVGPNSATTWTVTGANALTVAGAAFTGFSSITAGSGNDTFAISTAGRLSGRIDGGAGVNSLNYTHFTGNVTVDLALKVATNTAGVSNIQNVTGGIGNSLLVGDANANVLTGGPNVIGTLLLPGIQSRSILIGDGGADTLNANGSQDILIGGTTSWDKNATALSAIFAEWSRTDRTFTQRAADLYLGKAGDGSLNNGFDFNTTTVIADGAADILSANVGQDWIFVTPGEDQLNGGTASGDITMKD